MLFLLNTQPFIIKHKELSYIVSMIKNRMIRKKRKDDQKEEEGWSKRIGRMISKKRKDAQKE